MENEGQYVSLAVEKNLVKGKPPELDSSLIEKSVMGRLRIK